MIKTQHLRFLIAVVDYGSAIKAAERLHISQPSISAGLKSLEEELGGALFDRTGPANRPLRLTPKGQRFYRRAIEILSQCESAQAEFIGNAPTENKLILGVINTLPQAIVIKTVELFKENAPDTRLDIWEGSTSRIESWFSQKRLDIAVNIVGTLTPNSNLLHREPLVAVMSPEHPLASLGDTMSIRDLAEYPFIYRSNCELDSLGRARLKAEGVKLDVQVKAESDNLAFEFIRTSKSITLAPENLAPSDLSKLKVTGLEIERSIGLKWQEDAPLQIISVLTDAVEKSIKQLRA